MDILNEPGTADITCDVDFSLLKDAAQGLAYTHGPISQSKFLQTMGITMRLSMLLKQMRSIQEQTSLVKGVERLVGEMGQVYQVMAVAGKPNPVPVGFESQASDAQQSQSDSRESKIQEL